VVTGANVQFNDAVSDAQLHCVTIPRSVAHHNLCRWHDTIRSTPAEALGLTDHAWSIGELLDAALAVASPDPTETAPDRRRRSPDLFSLPKEGCLVEMPLVHCLADERVDGALVAFSAAEPSSSVGVGVT
jgi:hypothetical protein